MKRQLVSLLLVVVLLLTMVMAVACNQSTGNDTTAAAGNDTTAAAGDDTTAAAVSDEDLEVVTILCKSLNSNQSPGMRYSENPRWESIPMVQKLYDKFAEVGVRLEYEVIDDEQYSESVKTRLMTGVDLPEIILNPGLSEVEAINAGEAGIVCDVSALVDQYDEDGSIKQYWKDMVGAAMAEITTEDGNIWWFPYTYHREYLNDDGTEAKDHYDVSFHVSIREDWLTALGQEWKIFYTPEELIEVLDAFNKNDANGNGVQDEVISNFSTRFGTGFEQGFNMGYGLVYVLNDGKGVQCNLYNENLADYVAFMQELYNRGLIDTTVLNGTDVNSANRSSTYSTYGGQTWGEAAITGYEDTAIYSPIIIDDDEGENGYSVYMRDNKQMVLGKWFVNAQSEHLEAVVKVMDVLYTEEVAHMMTWGEEGLTYDVEDGIIMARKSDDAGFNGNVPTCRGMIGNNALPNVYDCRETREGYFHTQLHIDKYYAKDAMIEYVYDHDDKCTFQESVLPYAMLTNDERETISALQTTLETYIDEMMLKLFTGEYSMDDYPTYLAELESMGLKDYIAVYEARHQRWVDYANANGIESLYN